MFDMNGLKSIRVLMLAGVASLWTSVARGDDWPQWLGPQRDGVWREKGIIAEFPKNGPKIRWRTPIAGGYAGPAVADGKVYITDRVLGKGVTNPKSGFDKPTLEGLERVLCLNEKDGKILWKYEYDCTYSVAYPAGPRTTPIIAGGKVYTLGTMGDLLCLDAKDGKKIWAKNFVQEYDADPQTWGFSAHPLLDGDRLICLCGGKGSVAVAFDKNTGKEKWKALTTGFAGYAPPMIYDIGGTRQLIIWHPQSINSLNPETGKVYWSHVFKGLNNKGLKAALTVPTPRLDGDMLFVTAFYDGPLALKVKGTEKPTVLWRGKGTGELPEKTDGLHSIMPTPVIKDGYIYGVCSYGELRCLKADTGKRIWETYQATTGKSTRWGNAFLIPHEDRYILFNELGDLIIAKLSPMGYKEISRANVLVPTNRMAGRPVIWSHPAFANRCVYARNDLEIICVSMEAEK
jgi:outer membrane protein assembly factor BamB